MAPTVQRIGVIGVGTMGRPIALALQASGRAVTAYDASAAASEALGREGVAIAASVAELATECSVVVLSLPTPEVVAAVIEEVAGVRGRVVLDTSTIDPATSRASRARLLAVHGDYADCPVLGRPPAVGSWTIPVGGDPGLVVLAQEILGAVAKRVVGVGPTGSAATLKVLNNLMLGVINASTAEVLALAEAAGLDPMVFVDTLVDSGAASISGLFKDVAPRAVRGDFEPTFSVRLMHKDNALALDLAEQLGVSPGVARAAQEVNEEALVAGLGDEDSIAVLKSIRGRRHRG